MGFASLTVFTGIGNEDRNSLSQIRSVLILIYLFIYFTETFFTVTPTCYIFEQWETSVLILLITCPRLGSLPKHSQNTRLLKYINSAQKSNNFFFVALFKMWQFGF